MKYIKILLFQFILFISCFGQNEIKFSDLTTSWYEVKQKGREYVAVDYGYEGEWIRINKDSICNHGAMEEINNKIDQSSR
jgi:hypothetical protein